MHKLPSTTLLTINPSEHQKVLGIASAFIWTELFGNSSCLKLSPPFLAQSPAGAPPLHSHRILTSSEVAQPRVYPPHCRQCDHFYKLAAPSHPRIQRWTSDCSVPLAMAQTWESQRGTFELRRTCLQVAVLLHAESLDTAVLLILDRNWSQC